MSTTDAGDKDQTGRGPDTSATASLAEAATPVAMASRKSVFREYAEAILVAMLLAFAIRIFVVQAFKIPSGSMIPTLLIGDHILVSKLSYGLQWPADCRFEWTGPVNLSPSHWRLPVNCYTSKPLIVFGAPQQGDVIVFRYPEDEEKDFIKRIIGLPGDVVEIKRKIVYINGTALEDKGYTQRVDPGVIDPHINPRDNFGPVTVPPASYFVIGDHRYPRLDSRFWGFVSADKIKGKAFRIYWSWSGADSISRWVRWERIGQAIR